MSENVIFKYDVRMPSIIIQSFEACFETKDEINSIDEKDGEILISNDEGEVHILSNNLDLIWSFTPHSNICSKAVYFTTDILSIGFDFNISLRSNSNTHTLNTIEALGLNKIGTPG